MFQLNYPNPMHVNIPTPSAGNINMPRGKSTTGDFIKEIMGGLLQGMQQKKENEHRQQQMAIQKQQMAAGQQKLLMEQVEKIQGMWLNGFQALKDVPEEERPEAVKELFAFWDSLPTAKIAQFPENQRGYEKIKHMIPAYGQKEPKVETRWNEATGREEKVILNPKTGQWDPFGGQKAEKEDKKKYTGPHSGMYVGEDGKETPIEYMINPEDPSDIRILNGVVPMPKSGEELIVGPDGRVTYRKGVGVGKATEAPGVATTAMKTKLQEDIAEYQESLDYLQQVKDTYEPQFYTTKFKGIEWLKGEGEKHLGVELSPEDKALKEKYQAHSTARQKLYNAQKKIISGTAVSEAERKDLNKAELHDKLPPSDFEGRLKFMEKMTRLIIARKRYFLRNDFLTEKDIEESGGEVWNKKGRSLEAMERIIELRGEALAAQGLSESEVIERLNREFFQ